jgi:hypothetical protein
VLISGDIDFVNILAKLRHQMVCTVILIHSDQTKKELKETATFSYPWKSFLGEKKLGFSCLLFY